jgi:hypothetical protein
MKCHRRSAPRPIINPVAAFPLASACVSAAYRALVSASLRIGFTHDYLHGRVLSRRITGRRIGFAPQKSANLTLKPPGIRIIEPVHFEPGCCKNQGHGSGGAMRQNSSGAKALRRAFILRQGVISHLFSIQCNADWGPKPNAAIQGRNPSLPQVVMCRFCRP